MKFTVSVHVESNSTVVMFPDENVQMKIHESRSEFTLNGVSGNGICEVLTRE